MVFRGIWLALGGLVLLSGCGTVGFDPTAYQSVVQLKYETMSLLDNSSAPYRSQKTAADALLGKYEAAADAASAKTGNDAVVAQWAAIRDPQGTSAGNAIEMWKKAPLRPGQRAEKKRAIAAHFDHLICLEQNKQAATECGSVGSVPEAAAVAAPRTAPRAASSATPRAPRAARPKPGDAPPDGVEYEAEPQQQ